MQQHGILTGAARTSGFSRNGHSYSPEELSSEWSCKKRDGSTVPFNCGKIGAALRKCFDNCNPQMATDENGRKGRDLLIDQIMRAVVNNLSAQKITCPDVEQVQRLVIQQLWGAGLFEAAEHYQNYREARRKQRLHKPISPAHASRVIEDQKHFPQDIQYYQFMSKFSRWREEDKRRETWKEACYDRVLPWLFKQPLVAGKLSEQERAELGEAMYNLEASPAMRVVQMAGPALDRCNVGVYNCAYQPMQDLFSFPEMLYILMQGTGAGFSCESDYVAELPRIKRQRGGKPDVIVVPDDTEGWCNSYFEGIQRWFDGYDCWFDVTGVRKKNTKLKTKGGRASGPEPFLELMTFARNMIMARSKTTGFLDDTDVHRLACFTGRIVQVGGVRRAAEISLSDLRSVGMRNIKSGSWWGDNLYWQDGKYLSMANNSAVYEEYPDIDTFLDEMSALVRSKAGERGIFNRKGAIENRPARRKIAKFGANPCCEIILRPWEFCNLTMAIARKGETVESLKRKVRLATIFGAIQSTCTDFKYIREDWKKNCDEERLLGVDITGQADCELLQYGASGRAELLRMLQGVVSDTKKQYARRFGINESAADTCVKPGGDSAVLFDCGSGISDRFADLQIRWVREAKDTPVSQFLIDSGVPYADAPEAPEALYVFGFPRESPKGATTRNSHTAIQQLEMWLETKKNWAEHSVSVTIYVEPHEWPAVMAWVYEPENWKHLTGICFLPKDNGTYTYAPNEELNQEQYADFVAKFPQLNWSKLMHYEDEDMTTSTGTFACTGGSCEL